MGVALAAGRMLRQTGLLLQNKLVARPKRIRPTAYQGGAYITLQALLSPVDDLPKPATTDAISSCMNHQHSCLSSRFRDAIPWRVSIRFVRRERTPSKSRGADPTPEPKGEVTSTASNLDTLEKPPTYSRELAEQHNSTVPFIHRLPPQVLQAAFTHLEPDSYEAASHYYNVCRLWRRLLFKTPEFWAAIANGVTHTLESASGWTDPKNGELATIEVAVGWLSYSGTLPLRLKFTGYPRYMVDLMDPHRERIHSLTVRVRSKENTAALQTLLAKGMPHLTVLELSSAYTTAIREPPLKLEPEAVPCLRTLKIPGDLFGIGSDPTVGFRSLRELELAGRTYYPGAGDPAERDTEPFKVLRASLQRCWELRVLRISEALPYIPNPTTYHLGHFIEFPLLEEFTALDKPQLVSGLLSGMRCPPTTFLNFRRLPVPVEGAGILTAPLPRFGSLGFFPTFRQADVVALDTLLKHDTHPGAARYCVQAYRDSKRIVCLSVKPKTIVVNSVTQLCDDGRTPVRLAEELTHVFSASRTVRTLSISTKAFSLEEWGDLYRAFPEAERLFVTDQSSFNALYALQPLIHPWGTPVCPRLRELWLEWSAWSSSDTLHIAHATSPEKTAKMLREPASTFVEKLNIALNTREASGQCAPLQKLVVTISHLHPSRPENARLESLLIAVTTQYLAAVIRKKYADMQVYMRKSEDLNPSET